MTEDLRNQPIRTYKLRRGRVSDAQQTALDKLGDSYFVAGDGIINLAHDLNCPYFLIEIGFGMGEATVALAKTQPDVAVLAMDLHTPGIGKLIKELGEDNLTHVKLLEADALEILRGRIADSSVDAIRLFFPDPWPKSRHHKRRFIVPQNLDLVADKLKVGGALHIATDWVEYAENAMENLTVSPRWTIVDATPLCDPKLRPRTKFEQKGLDAGRTITDIVAVRVH
ncbi:MAG: hypothetical protein RL410_759 [Actinomycetota bacterium]|jgi:tRNA (guanine-N7-)-methyltransferase